MADFDSHTPDPNLLKLQNRNQYYAAFIVNLGALGLGTVIGWSSPSEKLIVDRINATEYEISWISSIMTLGAASSQIVMAILLKYLSCKYLLISMNVGLALSWIFFAFSTNIILFYVGRFFTGFFAGTNCVTVPIFTGEISHKSTRGGMGILFQLMLVLGILIMYCVGEFKSYFVMVFLPIVFPAILVAPALFLPQSPVHSIRKGKMEDAKKALKFFRGPKYEIDGEIAEIVAYATSQTDEKLWTVMKQRSSVNALLILVGLHFIQQLSGINAFMFYASKIFENAGSSLSPGISSIVMAIVQVLVSVVAAVLVDKVGRKLLMVVSLTILAASNIALGIYMLIAANKSEGMEQIQFIPVMVLSIYIIGFSLGAGPLPWALLGEMVPNKIKFVVNTGVACLNWVLAFAVTASFKPLQYSIGSYTVFFIFGGVCVIGIFFVYFCAVETKNKTLEEVQISLSNKKQGTNT